MPTIYVLLCEKQRYYIGKTDRPLHDRMDEHFNRNGSEWTKKYRPIKVVEQILNADDFDEDKYTKKYMKNYGIDKVRGGSYTQLVLPDYSVMALKKELCSASDLCFRCNRLGHFASQCYASTKADGSHIDDNDDNDSDDDDDSDDDYDSDDDDDDSDDSYCCEYCGSEFNTEYEAEKHEKTCKSKRSKGMKCFRCGRNGHYASNCYASSNISGNRLY